MNKKIIAIGVLCTSICLMTTGLGAYTNNSYFSSDQKSETKMVSDLKNDMNIAVKEETNTRILSKAVETSIATKNDIYYTMLNSIDYFDKISGTVYYPSPEDKHLLDSVKFQSVLSETKAYSHYSQAYVNDIPTDKIEDILVNSKNIKETVCGQEYYCSSGDEVCMDYLQKTYSSSVGNAIGLDAVCDIPNTERITMADDGQPCYNYRTNPTNVPDASMCIFPQEMAFGFLADQELWDVEGIERIDNKECYHIIGKTSKEYGSKLNVSTFDFYVDTNTGVLLKYIGYDENNKITGYMFAENISYENEAQEVKNFSKEMVSNFNEVKMYSPK